MCYLERHCFVMVCVAVHHSFSSACIALQWFFPSWAWSRAEKRLEVLFPDIHMRTIVLDSLVKLPLRQRIELLKESNEDTIGLLRHLVRLGAHVHCVVPVLDYWDLVPCNMSKAFSLCNHRCRGPSGECEL